MIIGYPIPAVFAKRVDDGTGKRGGNIYSIMDGKQRLSTVAQYLNDEFALTELPPVSYMDEAFGGECETDISGMKFSELPDALQDQLNSTIFSVTYFDNLTKDEERELFKRLNAGKPLSTKSRLLASCNDIEGLLDIGSHALFGDMLTDKARDNKNQATLVMKAWCMLNKPVEEVSFEGKDFNPLFEETQISDVERLELDKVFEAIQTAHTSLMEDKEKATAKKLYTETHMISLVPFFHRAITQGIEVQQICEWLMKFFGSDNERYALAAGNGSAKNANIIVRHNELEASFERFFSEE